MLEWWKDEEKKETKYIPKIAAISCGLKHTVAVTVDGRMLSWGLGEHKRLGHSEEGDEMVGHNVC